MNESIRRRQMIDYLYDEMESDERRDFERWLAENPEARAELEGLQETRMALGVLPEVKPAPAIFSMVAPRNPSLNLKWWKRAAVAAVIVAGLWFFNFRVQIHEGGVVISLGKTPETQQTPPPAETNAAPAWQQAFNDLQADWERKWQAIDTLLDDRTESLRKDQLALLTDLKVHKNQELEAAWTTFREQELPRFASLFQGLQIEQQAEIRMLLQQFWTNWQATRQSDLKNIDAHLTGLYQDVEIKQKATEAMFVSLMERGGGGR